MAWEVVIAIPFGVSRHACNSSLALLAGSRWSCLALVCLYLEETTQTKAAFLYFLVAMFM
jgi:hypothetical protein